MVPVKFRQTQEVSYVWPVATYPLPWVAYLVLR
jgi:hypothetical protein